MILLLCMTVGMFGVSCTGDDGAQGPPGPQGEQGPPGDAAAGGDVPEVLETYSFLKSWGVDEGVSCSSDILSTTADLPGPDLDAITTEQRASANNNGVVATCDINLFSDVSATQGTQGEITLSNPAPVANQIYLRKTHRLKESIKEGPTPSPATPSSLYSETTVTKDIVGGKVYAKLETTGADEPLERQLLHSQCDVGADPPDILGDFRAVRIHSDTKEYENGRECTGTGDDDPCAPTSATGQTLKYKVCVRLDAHPGQVKCLVVDHGAINELAAAGTFTDDDSAAIAADEKTIIGLYDGMDVNDLKVSGVNFGDATNPADGISSTGNFFGEAETAFDYEHICHLFGLE